MRRKVPAGWSTGSLRDLAAINAEDWDPRYGGTITYLDISSIERTGKIGPLKSICAEDAPSRARRVATSGDILVSTVRPYLRAFARVEDAPSNLIASTGFAVLSPLRPEDSDFVYQLILTEDFLRHLTPRMTGTGYPAVRAEDVAAYHVALPPAGERERIGEVLSTIDRAIEKTEAVIAATEQTRGALLQELLTRGLPGRHNAWKEVPGVGTVPECWGILKLGDVVARIDAGRSPNCDDRRAALEEWAVLKVSSVSWGDFRPEEHKALPSSEAPDPAYEVHAGDLLVSRANTPELVGRVVYVYETRPRLLLSDKTLRLVPDQGLTSGPYLRLALSLPTIRGLISQSATGSSRSMRNISQDSLRRLPLALPPASEQQAIVAATADIEARRDGEALYLKQLKQLKATAATALLSGDVRVNRTAGA